MEQNTPKDQDPPHGGSFLRQADGSVQLRESTKPALHVPAINPKPADQAGVEEE